MSAIWRFAAMTMFGLGFAQGCGDELGRAPWEWNGGSPGGPKPVEAGADRFASQDVRADVADASLGDASLNVDVGTETGIDTGRDTTVSAEASSDADASVIGDATRDGPVSDASRDGGDGGTISPLRAALLAKSPSCLSCAEAMCPSEFTTCDTIGGTTDAGRDGSAVTRTQLCTDTLMCIVSSQCDEVDSSYCYCGDIDRKICWVVDVAKGECKDKIERSFETTEPRTILQDIEMGDRETAGGWAFLLSRCLRDNACKSCLGRPEAGSDAPAEPDVRIDMSAPPIDVSPDLGHPVPDVQAEAEASSPPIDVGIDTEDASMPPVDVEGDMTEVDSTSNDPEDDGSSGEDTSLSDADSDI